MPERSSTRSARALAGPLPATPQRLVAADAPIERHAAAWGRHVSAGGARDLGGSRSFPALAGSPGPSLWIEPPMQSALEALHGGGEPLPSAVRAHFEPRFQRDFSSIRVHSDDAADRAAIGLHARALTFGDHIAFRRGAYQPHGAGRGLIAHELAHVAQQRSSPAAGLVLRDPAEPARPALTAGQRVAFTSLPDGQVVSDPTGRTHGITIRRRGQELFYKLPNGAEREVPRPLDATATPPQRAVIEAVRWGESSIGQTPILQTALSVIYTDILLTPFLVNVHGVGRISDLANIILRQPGNLEVSAGGLEVERAAGVLNQSRPAQARFQKATRYHVPGADFSLYVFADRTLEVAEDASGRKLWSVPGKSLVDFQMQETGRGEITWTDPTVGTVAVQIDIRPSRLGLTGLGRIAVSAARTSLLSSIRALGVGVVENGSRFTDGELSAALDTLQSWPGPQNLVAALKANGTAGLKLIKDIAVTGGSFDDTTGEVKIPGDIVNPVAEQRNTVIHEIGHALFHARGLKVPSSGVPAHVTTTARGLMNESARSAIDEGTLRTGRSFRARTLRDWEHGLSTDAELNRVWARLHHRFAISDPEATADIRGLDVADESRYLGGERGDVLGHGFDNVSEFVASFLASSRQFQVEMVRTIRTSGSLELAKLYRDLWNRVSAKIANLGATNPYDALVIALGRP